MNLQKKIFFWETRSMGDGLLDFVAVILRGAEILKSIYDYAKAILKIVKLNTVAQQREAVVQGRNLLPYRLRYIIEGLIFRGLFNVTVLCAISIFGLRVLRIEILIDETVVLE
jgi:hypothetical protein